MRAALALGLGLIAPLSPAAHALDVVLQDVAPDRVERQRSYNRGEVPFSGTPDLAKLDERLADKGLAKGAPIFIRIFKASSELEIWMQKGAAFVLLDTYPVCHWTGSLGPKIKEGDKQSPEGFYSVTNRQMRLVGRWQKAFNIGFPNLHDQLNKRTGSFILVHGGCSSIGCFAMTEQVQEEIYALAAAAHKAGQERFHVHIFPFRMTDAEMAKPEHQNQLWATFWQELKPVYDSFERTRIPPRVGICGQRYQASDGEPGEAGDSKALAILRPQSGQGASANACVFDGERQGKQTVAAARSNLDTDDEAPASSNRRRAPRRVAVRELAREREVEKSAGESARSESRVETGTPNGFGESKKRSTRVELSGG